MDSLTNPRKLAIIVLLSVLILAIGGAIFYYYNQPEQRASRIQENFFSTTSKNANFFTTAKDMENLLKDASSSLSLETEAEVKTLLGDSLSETDRRRGTELLKEVARNLRYSNSIRVRALTYIADHYELDFTDSNFAKDVTFTGENFANLISESGGDVGLAMRKLNEWSNALLPNLTANYRIALWYAEEIYKNAPLPPDKKKSLFEQMNIHLAEGDRILEQVKTTHSPVRLAIAYALKGRIIYLSGGDKAEANKFFQLAMKEYGRPPVTIFQAVHYGYDSLYYAVFLERQFGQKYNQDIIKLLRQEYMYLSTPQRPEKRNIRFVSFLIAARDSKAPDYPAPDFTKTDIENIGKIYPEFGKLINKLNLREYVNGHPAEAYIGK